MTVRIFNNKVFLLFNSKVLMCLSTSQDNIEKVLQLRKTIIEKAKTLKKPISELKLGEI
jgi:hypothetical protein